VGVHTATNENPIASFAWTHYEIQGEDISWADGFAFGRSA
jgi:hypothetical protein